MTQFGKVLATLATATVLTGVAAAQDIRFITVHRNELYEVVQRPTAGKFVRARGNLAGIQLAGYTDRVQRGDLVATIVLGRGIFNRLALAKNNRIIRDSFNVPAPFVRVDWVPVDTDFDNVEVRVWQGRGNWHRRLPIGRRP